MARIPESTKHSWRTVWPPAPGSAGRRSSGFRCASGPDSPTSTPSCRRRDPAPCRLRYAGYAGYANQWGFAIYRASHDDYQDSWLTTGSPAGTAEDALDTACGLYLNDPTAWNLNP